MDIDSLEIRAFLQHTPPFNRLDNDTLARLTRTITIRQLQRGASFPPADSAEPAVYLLRHGAVELYDSRGQRRELIEAGRMIFESCEETAARPRLTGICREETLLYQLPCSLVTELHSTLSEFASAFSSAPSLQPDPVRQMLPEGHHAGLLTVHCGDLARRPPVAVTPDTAIRHAASLMTEQHVSALLVSDGVQMQGIVTDRDLRTRCLARGLSPDSPIGAIMSTPLHQISADTSAYDALLAMTRLGIHHLPITAGGQALGMVTATDLLHHQSLNALHLVSAIRRSSTLESLIEQAQSLPELQCQLMAAGLRGRDLGKAVTTVIDALTVKLLELAEAQLGQPPVPYTWLVFGSQARQEQSAHTDQDNGLLIDDRYSPEHAPYFAALAEFVTGALDQCGIPLCAGDVMARNPKWCQPFSQWLRYFDQWVSQPEPMALMHLSIFFDLRALHGATSLADRLRDHLLSLTRHNSLFLAYLTANALHHRPPLGLFRQLLLSKDEAHNEVVDLKLNGIIPVVDLARVHALAAGNPALNSHERLMASLAEGLLSEEAVKNLLDVLDLLQTLRARHQAEQIRRGSAPDNFLAPRQLSSFNRHHLKDAFVVIATLQKTLAQRYQSERFA